MVELLLQDLNRHLLTSGKLNEFKIFHSENPTSDEINLSLMVDLAQRMCIRFPHNPDTFTLLDFCSRGYILPVFKNEEPVHRALGWNFKLDLDREKKKLGEIEFQRNFFGNLGDEELIKRQTYIFGAGRFLNLLNQNLEDITKAFVIHEMQLNRGIEQSLRQAKEEEFDFYNFLEKIGPVI